MSSNTDEEIARDVWIWYGRIHQAMCIHFKWNTKAKINTILCYSISDTVCVVFIFYLASICMYVLWICCCASFTFSCIIWARVSVCIIICEIKDDVVFARILLSDRFFSACYFIAWFSSRLVVHLMKFVCLFSRGVVYVRTIFYYSTAYLNEINQIKHFFPLPKHINIFSDVFFSRCAVVVVSMAVGWFVCLLYRNQRCWCWTIRSQPKIAIIDYR